MNSGYVLGTGFIVATAATLQRQLSQNLSLYSGIVVASDFGGLLTQAELQILNDNKTSIDNFPISGGGLLALGESNDGIGPNTTYTNGVLNPNEGLLGTANPYAFLPFQVQTVNSYGLHEDVAGLTAAGSSLGFNTNDFTGNYYFNTFQPIAGEQVLDTGLNGGVVALAVAISPEPASFGLVVISLAVLIGLALLRRARAWGLDRLLTRGSQ